MYALAVHAPLWAICGRRCAARDGYLKFFSLSSSPHIGQNLKRSSSLGALWALPRKNNVGYVPPYDLRSHPTSLKLYFSQNLHIVYPSVKSCCNGAPAALARALGDMWAAKPPPLSLKDVVGISLCFYPHFFQFLNYFGDTTLCFGRRQPVTVAHHININEIIVCNTEM